MSYQLECQTGRDHAQHVMRESAKNGNLPELVSSIREAAKNETGYGAGFLFALSEQVIQ